MKSTIYLAHGDRLIVQPSATGQSAQVTFHPVDGPPCGFLIPNNVAGVAAQAIEAVATLNEERQPVLDDLPKAALNPAALAAARRFASGPLELQA